jgi:hypothetical protein
MLFRSTAQANEKHAETTAPGEIHTIHTMLTSGGHGIEKSSYNARKGKMSSQRHTGIKTLTIDTTHTNWLPNQCD